ncbi:MAG: saccharopine dehydrogenase C-terminal domain-containing protein [Candidatus Thermoplasmatota archaeon]
MKITVLGAGMMGRAVAFDLEKYSNFSKITVADKDEQILQSAKFFLKGKKIDFSIINVNDSKDVKKHFQHVDVAISAVPYRFNYELTKIAVETKTHFLDLGGNNDIVNRQRSLSSEARKNGVTIIPDCGLAPGMASVITRDIVEEMDSVDYVKLRVGGLPLNPKPPLNYQIVFSPYGLINEYVEDAIVLDHGEIIEKQSMTELETIKFPKPFDEMEAFLTSGGCSTLPYTYKNKIDYLDYKTIRYPGHCKKFKTLLDLGFADETKIPVGDMQVVPRELLASLLLEKLPINEKDVVLIKVLSRGMKNGKNLSLDYIVIDYYDGKNGITAMMRTTAYPISITAQMIERNMIKERGVFCSVEIVPPKPFFEELKKRNIIINKRIEYE